MIKPVFLAGLCCVAMLLIGCREHSPAETGPPATRPWMFLGLPDDQQRTIEQDNPDIDGRLRGIAIITTVELTAYKEYQQQKQAGRISEEERHGGFIYYAIRDARDAGPAMVMVTARYKASIPTPPSEHDEPADTQSAPAHNHAAATWFEQKHVSIRQLVYDVFKIFHATKDKDSGKFLEALLAMHPECRILKRPTTMPASGAEDDFVIVRLDLTGDFLRLDVDPKTNVIRHMSFYLARPDSQLINQ